MLALTYSDLSRRVYDVRGSVKCSDDSEGPPCTGYVTSAILELNFSHNIVSVQLTQYVHFPSQKTCHLLS